MKPKFHHWQITIESLRKQCQLRTLDEVLERLQSLCRQGQLKPTLADMLIWQDEAKWYRAGSPYYKVWPTIVDAMATTSLDFDSGYLHWPYPVISVMLPVGHRLSRLAGPTILATFVTREETFTNVDDMKSAFPTAPNLLVTSYTARHRKLFAKHESRVGARFTAEVQIIYHMPADPPGKQTIDTAMMFEGKTVEWSMVDMLDTEPHSKGEADIGDEARSYLFKVVIAAAMFGIERHELVMPDISRDVLAIKGKTKGQKITERLRIARELKKCHGWRVGSEIDLPRPLIKRLTPPGTGTGIELEYGHIRSGHIRMQPCGKGGKDRKLIFLAPTVVRPDLPMRTTRGYRIHDKVLRR